LFDLSTRDLSYSALFAALISILSYVSIPLPFSPVPITGQSLAVILAGIVLTTQQAGLSLLIFLLLGSVGVPVFASGKAGIGVLAGPTGGYLIGYLLGAITISLLIDHFLKDKDNYLLVFIYSFIGGVIVVHLPGVFWLSHVSEISVTKAFMVGSLPFVPGDIFKLIIANLLGHRLKKHINLKSN